MTLKVNICSVRVPFLLSGDVTEVILKWNASMLCYSGQLRKKSVSTLFHSDRSAAASRGTRENRIIPERIGQNEEPISKNEERLGTFLVPT